jgi:hypothetical protein
VYYLASLSLCTHSDPLPFDDFDDFDEFILNFTEVFSILSLAKSSFECFSESQDSLD